MSQQLILAIGRESGSGGLDIARLLAERFGLPLYDKNILQTAAQERGVSPEKLTRYDEQPRSPCSTALSGATAMRRRTLWRSYSSGCCGSTPRLGSPLWYWGGAPRRSLPTGPASCPFSSGRTCRSG